MGQNPAGASVPSKKTTSFPPLPTCRIYFRSSMGDYLSSQPDPNGFYGSFGGSFVPPALQTELDGFYTNFLRICSKENTAFWDELRKIRKDFQGRPTPIGLVARLCEALKKEVIRNGDECFREVEIWLKREDLNHTGAHKLNHTMAEGLFAKQLGKKRLIAETGAGQHGVALATTAAYFGLECEIHMGAVDIAKEAPNVQRMKILGAKVVPATHGLQTLKEAVDSAFSAYLNDLGNSMYAIGSVVGPHPFPLMVREFQRIIGEEALLEFEERFGKQAKPNHVVACCGGGSNAIGIFSAFIDFPDVKLHAVEPLGRSTKLGEHAASLRYGSEGVMHGFKSIMLQSPQASGNPEAVPAPVHSIASGLDYPSVGPEHAHLASIGRTEAACGATDEEALKAFFLLSRLEGIIPALESAHAVAYAMKLAKREMTRKIVGGEKAGPIRILVNLSGRGDKDMDFVMEKYHKFAELDIEELLAP